MRFFGPPKRIDKRPWSGPTESLAENKRLGVNEGLKYFVRIILPSTVSHVM
jgi:hypothetical protein